MIQPVIGAVRTIRRATHHKLFAAKGAANHGGIGVQAHSHAHVHAIAVRHTPVPHAAPVVKAAATPGGCAVVPGPLPAGPGASVAPVAGQPRFGAALARAPLSGGTGTGGTGAGFTGVGGGGVLSGLGTTARAALVAGGLLAGGAVLGATGAMFLEQTDAYNPLIAAPVATGTGASRAPLNSQASSIPDTDTLVPDANTRSAAAPGATAPAAGVPGPATADTAPVGDSGTPEQPNVAGTAPTTVPEAPAVAPNPLAPEASPDVTLPPAPRADQGDNATPVPEPASVLLFLVGGLAALWVKRRRAASR